MDCIEFLDEESTVPEETLQDVNTGNERAESTAKVAKIGGVGTSLCTNSRRL